MPNNSESVALPHWMSDEEKMKYKTQSTNTNSAVKTAKRQGDVIAIVHPTAKTGYKAENAYGAKAIFEEETTTAHYHAMVQKVGDENQKKLMPYHPNASRNRPGGTLSNSVGRRFNPARNNSQISFRDGDPDSLCPPKTTTQVYSNIELDVVGLSNQGISAEKAKSVHQKQRR